MNFASVTVVAAGQFRLMDGDKLWRCPECSSELLRSDGDGVFRCSCGTQVFPPRTVGQKRERKAYKRARYIGEHQLIEGVVCRDCGAIVHFKELHDAFHERNLEVRGV